jgi:hypothetical protein
MTINFPQDGTNTQDELMRRLDEILSKVHSSSTKAWELENAHKELEAIYRLMRGRGP